MAANIGMSHVERGDKRRAWIHRGGWVDVGFERGSDHCAQW
jgi:hypothetical protein